MVKNGIRQLLEQDQVLLGLATMYPASGIIEGMCKGWDFVWVDGQHGEYSYDSVLHACQAASGMGIDVLLRVPSHDSSLVPVYADLAPSAIMAPMVETAEQARHVVRALHFPPLGARSYGGRRVVDLHGREFHLENNVVFVSQIETEESVENAAEIAAVEGVDVLFFGPDDMRVQMGLPINTPLAENKRLRGAMERTAKAARDAKKHCGCVIGDETTLRMALDMGYQLIVGGGDIVFLRNEAQRRRELFRGIVDDRPNVETGSKPASAY